MEKKNVNLSLLKSYSDLLPEEIEEKTLQSLEWFRSEMQAIYLNQDKMNEEGELVIQAYPFIGSMVMFPYDAKTKKKLPYWDMFPVVIVLEIEEDMGGFQGLNLHYLPPILRVRFLYELFQYVHDFSDEINEDIGNVYSKRLRLTYEFLQTNSNLKYFKPCLKRYLTSHVTRRIRVIPYEHWEVAAMLPSARWKGATGNQVYRDSRRIIRDVG